MTHWEGLEAKANELGAVQESNGINWTWFSFKLEAQAIAFDTWAIANGFETRGVYPPHMGSDYGVRVR